VTREKTGNRFPVLWVLFCACSGSSPGAKALPPVDELLPVRAITSGDAVLSRLPEGAEIVIELDLARLRDNEVIGDLAARAFADPRLLMSTELGVALDPEALARAGAVVLASYRVGTAEAITHVIYDDDAPVEVTPGHALLDDEAFLRLRASAMPAKAEGASLRITARLGFDARVALASQLGLDAAPASVSAWGDVADDLAVVALIDAGDVGGGSVSDEVGKAMAEAIRGAFDDLAALPAVRAVGLAPAIEAFEVKPQAAVVSVIALIGPSRLDRAASRARSFLSLMESAP